MLEGSCLCGAVAYTIAGPFAEVHHCHCRNCRKGHGAAFATYGQVARSDFRFTRGEESLGRYRSSPPCERVFCRGCGANLLFLIADVPDSAWVALGTLDSTPEEKPQAHLFVGSKAPWHDITDDLPRHQAFPEEP